MSDIHHQAENGSISDVVKMKSVENSPPPPYSTVCSKKEEKGEDKIEMMNEKASSEGMELKQKFWIGFKAYISNDLKIPARTLYWNLTPVLNMIHLGTILGLHKQSVPAYLREVYTHSVGVFMACIAFSFVVLHGKRSLIIAPFIYALWIATKLLTGVTLSGFCVLFLKNVWVLLVLPFLSMIWTLANPILETVWVLASPFLYSFWAMAKPFLEIVCFVAYSLVNTICSLESGVGAPFEKFFGEWAVEVAVVASLALIVQFVVGEFQWVPSREPGFFLRRFSDDKH